MRKLKIKLDVEKNDFFDGDNYERPKINEDDVADDVLPIECESAWIHRCGWIGRSFCLTYRVDVCDWARMNTFCELAALRTCTGCAQVRREMRAQTPE